MTHKAVFVWRHLCRLRHNCVVIWGFPSRKRTKHFIKLYYIITVIIVILLHSIIGHNFVLSPAPPADLVRIILYSMLILVNVQLFTSRIFPLTKGYSAFLFNFRPFPFEHGWYYYVLMYSILWRHSVTTHCDVIHVVRKWRHLGFYLYENIMDIFQSWWIRVFLEFL